MDRPGRTDALDDSRLGWRAVFGPPVEPGKGVRIRVVILRRAGEPLLLVPSRGRAAARALSLYAAQTGVARMARRLWRVMLRWGISVGLERDWLILDAAQPFLDYLRRLAGVGGLPRFAVLAGNPRSPGRRFLVLVFDEQDRPAAVVKVGTNPAAVELIERELKFLDSAPAHSLGIPKAHHPFSQGSVRAFALDFVEGDTPRLGRESDLAGLMTGWLSRELAFPLAHIPAWQRLSRACGADALFAQLARGLGPRPVQPALFHGDFAPWNIKVSPVDGSWIVLDWERGELVGPPAWDWFHYIIQTSILVEKHRGLRLVDDAQRLLNSGRFRAYAQNAGLGGREQLWFLAYLFHCRDVLEQRRILPQIPELLDRLAPEWLSAPSDAP